MIGRTFSLAALCVLLWANGSPAAEQPLTKEQQLNKLRLRESLLQLEERRASLATHAEELKASQDLFDRHFIALQKFKQTQNRHDLAQLNYKQAEINLEQVKLDLLKTATHLVVSEARKYRTEDGKSMVDIELTNASNVRDALMVDSTLAEEELLTLLKVEKVESLVEPQLFVRTMVLKCVGRVFN